MAEAVCAAFLTGCVIFSLGSIVFEILKCCIKPFKKDTKTNTPKQRTVKTPPKSYEPLKLVSLVREKTLSVAPGPVRLIVEQLVVKSWNETLTGVGRDATGLTHSFIQVKNVYVIKNGYLESIYESQYDTALQRLLATDCPSSALRQAVARTAQNLSTTPDILADVFDLRRGEILLIHGTPRDNVPRIVQNGFKGELNTRSSYGKGTYLSDSAQKADQYTDTRRTRRNKGLTMFLVGVALGLTVKEKLSHFNCGTVVAGSGKLFQEFVAKRDDFLLPQLLIEYNRV